MSFPVSPINGQTTIINNVVYVYNSSKATWTRISAGQPELAEYTDITSTGTATFAAVVADSATINTGISWANGDPWSSTTTYGNSNVANYLTSYNGTLSAGDVSISGNLFVNGNTTTLNANNITINDTLIYLANANPANTYDIGIVGHFTAGIYQHTGVVRDHTNNTWTFFSNATVEPTGNIITLTGAIYDAVKLGSLTAVNGQITGYHTGTIGANTANTGVFTTLTATSGYQGSTSGAHNGTIGDTTPNSVVATSVTTTSGGQLSGYHTGAIGANTANSGAFTSVTTTSGGQLSGYHTGAIGANTANTGAFTTLTASSTVNLGSITNLRITGGTNGQYLQTDGAGNLTWATGSGGGGGGSPGGSNAQVQFNDSGSFGGDTGLTYNKGSKVLTVTGNVVTTGGIYWANGTAFSSGVNTGSFTTISVNSSTTAISNSGTNGVGNIGALGAGFNTLFALSANAANADLAELYESDLMYLPGTVVEFGGDFEITEASANSNRIAGVISTKPGYLMNSEATGQFMLPVALQGRVPCKVIGPIRKGDMLISAGDGYAIASEDPKIGTVIGKAVQSLLGGSGVIEVVVGRI